MCQSKMVSNPEIEWHSQTVPAEYNINKMASKITSVSEANIGFLSSVSIPNLRQALIEHFLESNHESEDDSSDSEVFISVFSDKSSWQVLIRHVVQGIPPCSTKFTKD